MTVRKSIGVQSLETNSVGRIDIQSVDAATEAEIGRQVTSDDADSMLDAASFARRVRRRLGRSQAEPEQGT
jgi:putative transcriptional regulator